MDKRLITYVNANVSQGSCYFDVETDESEGPVLCGRTVVYNAVSSDITGNGGNIHDIFLKGAFDKCLAGNPEIFALWNHNWDYPLGKTSNGLLSLTATDDGIASRVRPSNTTYGRDLIELVRDGTVGGMSFGAYIRDYTWDVSDQVKSYRMINEADIFEVTFTHIPSFGESSAKVVRHASGEMGVEAIALVEEVARLREGKTSTSKRYADLQRRRNAYRYSKFVKKTNR
jgi:HK97 family phage prohead protease